MRASIAPPAEALEAAVGAARAGAAKRACAKSSRGAAVFTKHGVLGTGYNAQPAPRRCRGTEACRRSCGKLCVHAEENAIFEADVVSWRGPPSELELVHVKIEGGELVAGGPPSCITCSRTILNAGIAVVWLFQEVWNAVDDAAPRAEWRRYTAAEFHEATIRHPKAGIDKEMHDA